MLAISVVALGLQLIQLRCDCWSRRSVRIPHHHLRPWWWPCSFSCWAASETWTPEPQKISIQFRFRHLPLFKMHSHQNSIWFNYIILEYYIFSVSFRRLILLIWRLITRRAYYNWKLSNYWKAPLTLISLVGVDVRAELRQILFNCFSPFSFYRFNLVFLFFVFSFIF